MAYYKICPDCRGHGVIDHVNFSRPGPCLWTEPCRRCMPMRVVLVEKDEILSSAPAPASAAKEEPWNPPAQEDKQTLKDLVRDYLERQP